MQSSRVIKTEIPNPEFAPFIESEINHKKVKLTSGKEIDYQFGEFWTNKQRQAASIHEISYRACFKPQLPDYFIHRFTSPGDLVYDPFGGRGTTVIQAAIRGRQIIQNDINPLSIILTKARLTPPSDEDLTQRLNQIPIQKNLKSDLDLTMFFEAKTFLEILSLREYFIDRRDKGVNDHIDDWIQMVATNRLTGHSSGFFSVYTFPPNQAISAKSQIRINEKRKQIPEYRDTKKIILKKSKGLLRNLSTEQRNNLAFAEKTAMFLNTTSDKTKTIENNSVQLVVTSPPFLDIVQYVEDNWMRCWFNDLDAQEISNQISIPKDLDRWNGIMSDVLAELFRITKPGGIVAFEVGEIRKGSIKLDEEIVPLGETQGFITQYVMINSQEFTKTSNIWGVTNNGSGTNTNRIVVFKKP
jgi:DNA modification methylase